MRQRQSQAATLWRQDGLCFKTVANQDRAFGQSVAGVEPSDLVMWRTVAQPAMGPGRDRFGDVAPSPGIIHRTDDEGDGAAVGMVRFVETEHVAPESLDDRRDTQAKGGGIAPGQTEGFSLPQFGAAKVMAYQVFLFDRARVNEVEPQIKPGDKRPAGQLGQDRSSETTDAATADQQNGHPIWVADIDGVRSMGS